MSKNKNIHVVPRKDGWAVVREGNTRAALVRQTKAQATAAGREIARRDMVEIVIHGPVGRFKDSGTVLDPHSPRSSDALAPQDKARLWREWAAGHPTDPNALPDSALTRETIYGERG
jgi:hypothetical protein